MDPHKTKEEEPGLLDEFTHHFKSYASTLYELYMLKTVQKITSGTSSVLVLAIVVLFAIFLIGFAGIGTALWLNQVLGHPYCGFFIVAGVYALICVLIYVNRKKGIRRSIQDLMIEQMLND
jgi:heme A synthase